MCQGRLKATIWPRTIASAHLQRALDILAKRDRGAVNLAAMGIRFGDNGDRANGGMAIQNLLDFH
jgi:hypothetical protein